MVWMLFGAMKRMKFLYGGHIATSRQAMHMAVFNRRDDRYVSPSLRKECYMRGSGSFA